MLGVVAAPGVIGRDQITGDPSLSRRHAEIALGIGVNTIGPEFLYISDLDSRSGTFIDGRPWGHGYGMLSCHSLPQGAIVRCGSTVAVAVADIAPYEHGDIRRVREQPPESVPDTYKMQRGYVSSAIPYADVVETAVEEARSAGLRVDATAIETCLLKESHSRERLIAAVVSAARRACDKGRGTLRGEHFVDPGPVKADR